MSEMRDSISGIAATDKTAKGKAKEEVVEDDRKFLKRKLPEPRDGWADASGKTHRRHLDLMVFHKFSSRVLWQLLDALRKAALERPGLFPKEWEE